MDKLLELSITPLAMCDESLIKFESKLHSYLKQHSVVDIPQRKDPTLNDLQYNADTKVGVIPIQGLLVDKYDAWLDYFEGITAYEDILSNAQMMLDAGANTIVLAVDSGGGEVYGMVEASRKLRRIVDTSGANLVTYNDGTAASAAYAISSSAHVVISNPAAMTGSIGIVASLTDMSEYMKQLGIKREYITAGEGKVPVDGDGKITPEYKADVQNKVNSSYEDFTNLVADNRMSTQDLVKSLGAKVYTAQDALKNGLIDAVMTREEFFNNLADVPQKGKINKMSLSSYFKPKATQLSKEAEMPQDNVELQAALEAVKAEFTAKLDNEKAAFADSLKSMKAELDAAQASLAAVEKEKADAKQASRLSELTALFGTEEAPKLAASFAALDDAAFSLTVGILASRSVKEEEKLQAEVGADGVVVVDKPVSYAEAAVAAVNQLNSKNKVK